MNELFSELAAMTSSTGVGILLGTILSTTVIAPAVAHNPPEQTQRELMLDATQLNHLHSRMGDGKLILRGEPELSQITVTATIYYYDEEDIIFSLEPINEEGRLEAGFMGGQYSGMPPYMQVEIRVPQHFSVDVRHGDGAISIQDLEGMLTLESGIGDIDVANVGGVRIEHRSGGKVSTRNIHGPVRISQR